MEGFGKVHRVGAGAGVFLLLLVIFGSVFSPVVAARPTVGFLGSVREVETAQARPCHMAAGGIGSPENRVKVAESYAPLLLNVLPRGNIPPSAPSKGINDVKT